MSKAYYLYAITQPLLTEQQMWLCEQRGLADRPLHFIAEGGLVAVVSGWGADGKSPTPVANTAAVLRHEAIIEAVMAVGPTLPVRFGTVLADTGQVCHLLTTRQASFMADLAHVTGRVEMGVRILWEPPAVAALPLPSDGLPPGRRYLQEKAQRRQHEQAVQSQGDALAQAIHQALRPWAVDYRMQVLQTPRLLLSAAYLVSQAAVADFRAMVATQRQRYPALAFLATGPWPAYHFLRAADSAPAALLTPASNGAAQYDYRR